MKRVVWAAAAISAVLLAGCNSPHLALSQPSAVSVPVGGTLAFAGIIQDANGTILWKLDGPGSLTNTSGLSTVYVAPSTYPSPNQATLTASLGKKQMLLPTALESDHPALGIRKADPVQRFELQTALTVLLGVQ